MSTEVDTKAFAKAVAAQASVSWIRSWDHNAYLTISKEVHG